MAKVEVELRINVLPDEDGVMRDRIWSYTGRDTIELNCLPDAHVGEERAYLCRCHNAVLTILKEFDCAQVVEEG